MFGSQGGQGHLPEVPVGPGLAKCAVPECSSPHALKAWSPLGILWGHPGKGFVLRQGRGLRASAQPRLTAVGAPGP